MNPYHHYQIMASDEGLWVVLPPVAAAMTGDHHAF